MQTGKLRRTVCKLQQLRQDFYAFPATDLTLWYVARTRDSQGKLPPGLKAANRLFTVQTINCEYYITAGSPTDPELAGLFSTMINRCDGLLKQAGLTTIYDKDTTFFAVVNLALTEKIDTVFPYYWQGGTRFAKSWVDISQVTLACLDWFVKIDQLPEAIGDTLDELLNPVEHPETVEPSDLPVSSEEKQPPSKPEPQQPKRYHKKPAVPAEKTQRERAFDWLKLWHKYGTENFNTDPIPEKAEWRQWMAERNAGEPGPSPSTFTLMFAEKFGSHAKYLIACRTGRIEQKLTLEAGDAVRVYQGQIDDRSTTDPEQDLD